MTRAHSRTNALHFERNARLLALAHVRGAEMPAEAGNAADLRFRATQGPAHSSDFIGSDGDLDAAELTGSQGELRTGRTELLVGSNFPPASDFIFPPIRCPWPSGCRWLLHLHFQPPVRDTQIRGTVIWPGAHQARLLLLIVGQRLGHTRKPLVAATQSRSWAAAATPIQIKERFKATDYPKLIGAMLAPTLVYQPRSFGWCVAQGRLTVERSNEPAQLVRASGDPAATTSVAWEIPRHGVETKPSLSFDAVVGTRWPRSLPPNAGLSLTGRWPNEDRHGY